MIDEKKLIDDLLHNDGMKFEVTVADYTAEAIGNAFQEFINKMKEGFIDLINTQPQILFSVDLANCQQWISVKERLPEEHDSIWAKLYGTKSWQPGLFRKCSYGVLACVEKKDGRRRVISIRTFDGKWDHNKLNEETVICWMPLPEPPKDGER